LIALVLIKLFCVINLTFHCSKETTMKLGKKLKASHEFFRDSFNRYWFFYAVDWGFCVALYLIGGAVIGFVPPVERYFLLGQPELSYPHMPTDSVQFQYLMIILVNRVHLFRFYSYSTVTVFVFSYVLALEHLHCLDILPGVFKIFTWLHWDVFKDFLW